MFSSSEMKSPALHIFIIMLCAALAQSQVTASKSAELQAHINRGEAALRTNDMETASREFRAVLALDPKNTEAHANLGVIEFFRNDCQSAAQDLRQAVAAKPSLARAEALLGMCEKRLGDRAAQKTLDKAFSHVTDLKLRTQVGLELTDLYQRNGDLEHVASVMGALVGLNPESPDILYFAQRTYSELANDTLNKLAVVAPGSGRMQQVIAERLVNGGDLKGAIEHYRKTLEIDPHLAGVHYELSEAIIEASPSNPDSLNEAEKELQTAITNEGDSANIEAELGRIAYARSDIEQAFAHYTKAYSFNSGNVDAQLGLARVLAAQEKPQEAVKYLREAIAADPLNGEAHYRLALVYRTLKMPDDAKREVTLYEEIKKTKDQVKQLYREMNLEPKPEVSETSALPK